MRKQFSASWGMLNSHRRLREFAAKLWDASLARMRWRYCSFDPAITKLVGFEYYDSLNRAHDAALVKVRHAHTHTTQSYTHVHLHTGRYVHHAHTTHTNTLAHAARTSLSFSAGTCTSAAASPKARRRSPIGRCSRPRRARRRRTTATAACTSACLRACGARRARSPTRCRASSRTRWVSSGASSAPRFWRPSSVG